MIIYDPRGMTWEKWCALMAELFASNQLGTVTEDKWRDWASGMQGIGYFVNSGVPDPRGFNTWQDWASSLVGIMSINPTQAKI
jgi:hypothetical protein